MIRHKWLQIFPLILLMIAEIWY